MPSTDLGIVKRARSWGLRLLLVLTILMSSLPALPIAAAPSRGAIHRAPTEQSPALPEGTVVTGPEIIPELDRPPAEAAALVVDTQNPAWVTLYGSEMARQSLPPRVPASFEAAPEGPAVPLGAWQTHLLQSGTRRITAIAGVPDGRLFVAVNGDGLRVYAPDANGVYAWSAIHASASGLASNSVTALAYFGGELWVGTQGAGISALNLSTGAWRQLNVSNSPIPNNTINAIRAFRSPTGTNFIWIATSGGAARYVSGAILPWRTVNTASGLSNNVVFDIAAQFSGSTTYTWFGTADDVDRWDGGSGWTHVSQTGSGSCGMQRATRIVVDHANAVWFAGETEVPGVAAAPPAEGGSAPEQGYWVPIGACRRTVGAFGIVFWALYNADIPGLPTNAITDMSVDHAGRVWMGFTGTNAGGVAAYDQGTWLLFETAPPLYQVQVNAVAAVGEAVWFGHNTATALSVYSPNWQRYGPAQMQGSGTPGALLIELTRTWVGLGNGVSWRDAATWGHFDIAGNSSAVSALARDGTGLLWIGTAGNGLYAHNGTSITTHQTTADGLPHNDVRALLVDQAGRLWVATAGGLALRGNGYWIGFTTATSPLTSNDLRTLTQDATGRIWIGTAANGIHIYDPNGSGNVWTTQTTANGLPSNNIRGLATDPSGAIWAATSAGVGRWNPTTGAWTVYNQAGGALPSNDAMSIASDPVGRIWVGTLRGLAYLEAGAWQQFHVTGTMLGTDLVRVVASDGVRLWTASGSIVAVRGVLTGPIGNFPPIINSFTPTQGAPLTTVTINGSYFDDRGPSYNEVRFCCLNGQTGTPAPLATVISATATTLIVQVPLLANTGKIRVTSHGLNGQSATDFKVAPKIDSISPACVGMGEVLQIHGSGFFGQQFAAAQVRIGNGQWRNADFQDPTLIQQYVRPGDTAGPVQVRLSNGLSATSPQSVSIATPQVAATAIQQAVQGLPMIWGKRTLVQVSLRSAGASCNSRVSGGQLDWKLKNGTTRPGSYAIITSDSGLVVTPNAPSISVDSTVNFVAEFNSNRSQWSEPFSLSQFNGVRITLKNGPVQILSLDIPASAFNYVDTAGRREFISMEIAPPASATTQDASATQLTTFWSNALESMADVARVYPMQDTHWTSWLNYTPIYFRRSSADLSDDSDDYEEIRDDVDDYIEPSGIRQAMALIHPDLYDGGPSGKATLGHPTSVTFNFENRMAPIFLQEGIHALDWVDPDSPNHDSDNEYHSRYDEAERTDICTMSLTFRRALLDQMGYVPRVVRLRYEEDPYEFSLVGCDPDTQPRSAMSYAPTWRNRNTFLEPLDYLFTLYSICLTFGPGGLGSACPGLSIPLNNDVVYNQVVRYLAAHRPAAIAPPDQVTRTLRIGGSIDTSDRVTVTLSYLAGTDGELTPAVPGGDYHLQLRSATGALLWDHPFDIIYIGTHSHGDGHPLSRSRFNLLVPFPDSTVMAEIRHNDQVIWSDTVSSNAPTVNFTGPNGGTFNASGVVPVTWTAADADGDALQFALEYSADNGQSWILIAPALTGNAFNWQPGFVPPSASGRLRLRASDGFLTGTATSAPFTLNAQPPEAYILTPDDGQTFLEGSTIALGGTARTANGLDQGTFQWKRGGLVIGSGRGISYTLDAIGIYTFTLQVTANSLTASDSVTVTVVPDYDKDGMPNAWELSYKLNPLDSTDTVGDPDSDGLGNLDEYELGTNPRGADTDGDGANDGSEVAAGTDPLKADQKPATGPVLSVGANEIGFTVEGGVLPAPKEIWVTNTGAGNLAWTATDDVAWLQVSPSGGNAPTKLTLSLTSVQGLAYGTHTGHVTVSAAGASGSPHVITVELHIEAGTGYRLYMPGAKVQSGQ